MIRKLLMCCTVLMAILTGPVGAQSGPAGPGAGDPVSGTWTGMIGPGATPSYGITMELKFDGTRSVSGTARGEAPNDTAVLRTGVFDAQTGAMKLEFDLQDGGQKAVFEGIFALDTATGRLTLSRDGNQNQGTFLLKRRTATSVTAAAPVDTTAPLRQNFTQVSGWVTTSANLVPADKYSYQPVKTVRTVGQLLGHIADSYVYSCSRAAGRNVQWSDAIEKGPTDKATLLPKLTQALQGCTAAYASGQSPVLIENLGHTSLHYGNLVTYLRMLGLTPPSS